jgi:hypothetical protein
MAQSLDSTQQQKLIELASQSYRSGDREQAKLYLGKLLKGNPTDHYANHFLGAIFLMEGNLEAALKYWNRIGEPRIEQIRMHPAPSVDPVLMDRVFAMAPASRLLLKDYLETESRLDRMGIFKRYQFQLRPRSESPTFDLVLRPQASKGILQSKLKIAALVARGFLTNTVAPKFLNIDGTAINSTSFLSWDKHRSRISSSVSLPVSRDPNSRLRMFTDHKFETWSLGSDVELRKSELGIEADKVWNDRMTSISGAKASNRKYSGLPSDSPDLTDGWVIEAFGQINISLMRVPEKRLILASTASAEMGKFVSTDPANSYVQFASSLNFAWFPHALDEDLATSASLQFGQSLGDTPFDEFFNLSADEGIDLRLRAHRSRRDKYGENPFGTRFVLMNFDISKTLVKTGKVQWKMSPFADAAHINRTEFWPGPQWFMDVGVESGFQILKSLELTVTYGKDLRTGRNVVYFGANL